MSSTVLGDSSHVTYPMPDPALQPSLRAVVGLDLFFREIESIQTFMDDPKHTDQEISAYACNQFDKLKALQQDPSSTCTIKRIDIDRLILSILRHHNHHTDSSKTTEHPLKEKIARLKKEEKLQAEECWDSFRKLSIDTPFQSLNKIGEKEVIHPNTDDKLVSQKEPVFHPPYLEWREGQKIQALREMISHPVSEKKNEKEPHWKEQLNKIKERAKT